MNPEVTPRIPCANGYVGWRAPAFFDKDRDKLIEAIRRDLAPVIADALIKSSAPSATISVVFQHSHPASYGSFWMAMIDGRPVEIKDDM